METPWQPRYWPVWIGFGILRLLVLLPFPWQLALGRALGRLLRRAMKSRDRVARRNLDLCLPELDEDQRSLLLDEVWNNIGALLFEAGLAWWASARRIDGLIDQVDVDRLDRAGDQGTGVLLLAAHMTHLEMGGRILCRTHADRKAGLYRSHGNAALQYLVRRGRHYTGAMFSRRETRSAVRHLRRGGVLWYAPDQDYERGESVFAPFFGVPASTSTSAHQLARLGRARVMVVRQQRTANGYRLSVEDLPNVPSDDPVADCTAINLAMESVIRDCPGQYLWIHRRFKNRPPGEAPVY